jgi:APA family basic amino acid/polyamine antiporter
VARGLSGYLVLVLNTVGVHLPSWLHDYGVGMNSGEAGGSGMVFRVDMVACLASLLIMAYLLYGTKTSSWFNTLVTAVSVVVILFVILAGAFYVDKDNWSPFAPFGLVCLLISLMSSMCVWCWVSNLSYFPSTSQMGIFRGAAFVFFSYLGFDSVGNAMSLILVLWLLLFFFFLLLSRFLFSQWRYTSLSLFSLAV